MSLHFSLGRRSRAKLRRAAPSGRAPPGTEIPVGRGAIDRANAVAGGSQSATGRLLPPMPGVAHGTTIVALRYDEGRGRWPATGGRPRATRSPTAASRRFSRRTVTQPSPSPARRAPRSRWCGLFQTQLEHYEKVEGDPLSLEGKANQLGQMVGGEPAHGDAGPRRHPACSPAIDLRLKKGRIFTYDVTGGRFEETDFHATGSGGRDAKNTIKLGYRDRLARDEAVELAVAALYEAADEDTATGGPDPLRGIYPVVATVDAEGYTAPRRHGGGRTLPDRPRPATRARRRR